MRSLCDRNYPNFATSPSPASGMIRGGANFTAMRRKTVWRMPPLRLILHLYGRVQAGDGFDGELAAIGAHDPHGDLSLRSDAVAQALGCGRSRCRFSPSESTFSPGMNCNGSTPMPIRFER